jgi:predicted lipoprotein with Yx(FWY)xxD motif
MTSSTTSQPSTRRWLAFGILPAAFSLLLAACSGASASPSPAASEPAAQSVAESVAPPSEAASSTAAEAYVLTVAQTDAGSSLAGEGGLTLYTKADDTPTTSTCSGGCATTWPPFTVEAGEEVTPGEGVTGTIGTITRDDGSLQVTYNGHPLYYYQGDAQPGDATGQGLGGVWFIADPAM